MSEETNVLDFLRVRFNRLDDHTRKFDEVISRLGALERGQADLHVGLAATDHLADRVGEKDA